MDPLYRQAVVQGVVFVASTISFTIYLGIAVAFFAFIVLPVLDHRR
jgi:hypothetical protein